MTLITLLYERTFSIVGDIFCWSHVNKTFLHNSLCGQLNKKCSTDSTAVSQLVH